MAKSTHKTTKGRAGLAMILSALLLSLPLFAAQVNLSAFFAIFGRLHPVIVHFPIVLIPLAALLEWLFGSFKGPIGIAIIRLVHALAMYSAVASVALGFFLYTTGDYSGSLSQWHMWTGIAVALMMIWCQHSRRMYDKTHRWRWRQISRLLIFLAAATIFGVGHTGGSLTHGPDYLVDPIRKVVARWQQGEGKSSKSPQSLEIFSDVLIPAFERHCMQCHNPRNAKSDLDLSSFAAIQSGGKTGKTMVVAGQPTQSELLRRVILPATHDEYMPPDRKPPLRPVEVAILQAWIEAGAQLKDTLGTLLAIDSLRRDIDDYLPVLIQHEEAARAARLERLKMGPKLARLGSDLGLIVRPDPATDSALYVVSMQLPPKLVTDETLSRLMPYKQYFSTLSLVSSHITDEGLYYIGQMPNLRHLILMKTCIDGRGLVHLTDLPALKTLNLSHTDLTDEHALFLTRFQALENVYLFNTEVSGLIRANLDRHLTHTSLTFQEGPLH